MVKRHTRPQQVRRRPARRDGRRRDRARGPDPRLQRDAARPQGRQAHARAASSARTASASASPSAPAPDSTDGCMARDRHPRPPEDPLPGGDPPGADRALRLLLGHAGSEDREDHRSTWASARPSRTPKCSRPRSEQLATIAGQQPSVRRARKSIAAFKLREGMPVGVAVTLRGERGYEFLDRLISIAIPRIRDFRGLNPRSFDGRGNYSMGVREQIIFPEIDYDAIDQVRGLDITITTSARTDAEAFALLEAFGMPFAREGRPGDFESAEAEREAAPRPRRGGRRVAEVEPRWPRRSPRRRRDRRGGRGRGSPAEAAVDAAIETGAMPPRRPSRWPRRPKRPRTPPRPSSSGGRGRRGGRAARSPRPLDEAAGRDRRRRRGGGRAKTASPRREAPPTRATNRARGRLMAKTLSASAGAPAEVQDPRLYSLQSLRPSARGVPQVRAVPDLPARPRAQRPDPRDDEVLLVGAAATRRTGEPMSMTDPIADFLTRIRNAIHAAHETVDDPGLQTEGRARAHPRRAGLHRLLVDRAEPDGGPARSSASA